MVIFRELVCRPNTDLPTMATLTLFVPKTLCGVTGVSSFANHKKGCGVGGCHIRKSTPRWNVFASLHGLNIRLLYLGIGGHNLSSMSTLRRRLSQGLKKKTRELVRNAPDISVDSAEPGIRYLPIIALLSVCRAVHVTSLPPVVICFQFVFFGWHHFSLSWTTCPHAAYLYLTLLPGLSQGGQS